MALGTTVGTPPSDSGVRRHRHRHRPHGTRPRIPSPQTGDASCGFRPHAGGHPGGTGRCLETKGISWGKGWGRISLHISSKGEMLAAVDFCCCCCWVFFVEGNKEKVVKWVEFCWEFHQNVNGTSIESFGCPSPVRALFWCHHWETKLKIMLILGLLRARRGHDPTNKVVKHKSFSSQNWYNVLFDGISTWMAYSQMFKANSWTLVHGGYTIDNFNHCLEDTYWMLWACWGKFPGKKH